MSCVMWTFIDHQQKAGLVGYGNFLSPDFPFCTMPPNVDRSESAAVRRRCTLPSNVATSLAECRTISILHKAQRLRILHFATTDREACFRRFPKKHSQLPIVRIIMQLWLPSPPLIPIRKQRVCWAGVVPRCERSRGVGGSS